jgi:hypothetical protein
MPKNVMTARVCSLPGEENITAVFVVSRHRLKFIGDIEFTRPDILFPLCFKHNKGYKVWF